MEAIFFGTTNFSKSQYLVIVKDYTEPLVKAIRLYSSLFHNYIQHEYKIPRN